MSGKECTDCKAARDLCLTVPSCAVRWSLHESEPDQQLSWVRQHLEQGLCSHWSQRVVMAV